MDLGAERYGRATPGDRGEAALTFGCHTRATDSRSLRALEAAGFDALWVGGHVANPQGSPEVMMQLARLAALTDRVRIGTAVLALPLYPPAIVAKQVADVDRVSSGRVALGVGLGGDHAVEFEACGVPFAERGRRADEAIPLLRLLWTAEPVSHDGPAYPLHEVRISPPPFQAGGPPIIVSGRTHAAMARAARLGDGWMPYLYSAEQYRESVATIRSLVPPERSLEHFAWTALIGVTLGADRADADADAAAFAQQSFGRGVRHAPRSGVTGPTEEVVDRLLSYIDAGVDHVIIGTATLGDQTTMAQRIADEVLPQLRARSQPA
jgi:probable F420-dependent oxidoreductase